MWSTKINVSMYKKQLMTHGYFEKRDFYTTCLIYNGDFHFILSKLLLIGAGLWLTYVINVSTHILFRYVSHMRFFISIRARRHIVNAVDH